MKNRIRMLVGMVAVAVIVLQAPAFFHSEDNIAYGYFIEQIQSKSASDSKTSSSNSFAATLDYSDAEGYIGTLSKDGSSFVKSGQYIPGHVHTNACRESIGSDSWRTYVSNNDYHKFYKDIRYKVSVEKLHNSGTYDFSCIDTGDKDPFDYFEIDYDYGYDGGLYVSSNRIGIQLTADSENSDECYVYLKCLKTANFRGLGSHYSLTVIKQLSGYSTICELEEKATIDTRIWQQNYSGIVVKTVTKYPKLQSIEILEMPDRINYQVEEDFDTKGMIVQATYEDGHQEIIEMKNREGQGIS